MEGTVMTVSKPVRKSDWKDGFLFLGNHLALDFLNTSPVQNGEAVELLPDFDALLRWFQAVHLLSSREAASLRQQWGESAQHVAEAMRELREKLRKEILSWERGGTVHSAAAGELNRLMAEHRMLTRLKAAQPHHYRFANLVEKAAEKLVDLVLATVL
jgi:predicted RNA-binding Zn ribbon-like protein